MGAHIGKACALLASFCASPDFIFLKIWIFAWEWVGGVWDYSHKTSTGTPFEIPVLVVSCLPLPCKPVRSNHRGGLSVARPREQVKPSCASRMRRGAPRRAHPNTRASAGTRATLRGRPIRAKSGLFWGGRSSFVHASVNFFTSERMHDLKISSIDNPEQLC